MSDEHQTIEYKQSWRDEYLKWICGYANAQGGTLYIGKYDDGKTSGLTKAKKLMEDLPNMITSGMGIIADVNLHNENGLKYIEIHVDKYPSLISYHGKYYYRSGSTMKEITGTELDRKLLKAQGKSWEGMPIPKLRVSDLDTQAIDYFRKEAVKRGRLTPDEVSVDDELLMDNLHLIDEEGYLIRAAVIAFYGDPEKYVTGSYIKVGFFGEDDSDLQYQDEIHGPLILQIKNAVDMVYSKYLKARISYEGINRDEQYIIHKDAFREILLNACIHKNFQDNNPVQVSVYEDKVYIYNDGIMPTNLRTTKKLYQKHFSKPFNPILAHIFFLSGMVETWGRGFEKIKKACAIYDSPLPRYEITDEGIMVLCRPSKKFLQLLPKPEKVSMQKKSSGDLEAILSDILEFCSEPKSAAEIKDYFNVSNVITLKRKYLNPLLELGKLEMTIPDKPRSKNQRYLAKMVN